jgi:hypothetical protein
MGSELAKALAAVQADLPHVTENKVGKIEGTSKTTGKPFSYEYKYADLTAVAEAILPLLGKHELAFTSRPTLIDGRFVLAYSLLHSSGEREDGEYPLPDRGTPQELGKHISYGRRYCLSAVTGVAPGGEDNDAAEATEVHTDRERTGAPYRPQRPPSRPTATPVRTATTGADHERLRYGTVEGTPDDHPADRGPLPAGDDPWLGKLPEELPGSADPGDVRAIQAAYTKLKFSSRTDREQLLRISEQLTGRELTGPNPQRTHNNLTGIEAKELKHVLQGLDGDRGKLMERLNGVAEAVAEAAAQAVAEATQDEPGGTDGQD